jgi:hypothetical protein
MMTFLTILLVMAITPEMLRLMFVAVGLDMEMAPEMPIGRIVRVGRKCGS